eukprot:4508521-Pyramimonas_sp.AAC.1
METAGDATRQRYPREELGHPDVHLGASQAYVWLGRCAASVAGCSFSVSSGRSSSASESMGWELRLLDLR